MDVSSVSTLSSEVYWQSKFLRFVLGRVILKHLFVPNSDIDAHSYYPHGSIEVWNH